MTSMAYNQFVYEAINTAISSIQRLNTSFYEVEVNKKEILDKIYEVIEIPNTSLVIIPTKLQTLFVLSPNFEVNSETTSTFGTFFLGKFKSIDVVVSSSLENEVIVIDYSSKKRYNRIILKED